MQLLLNQPNKMSTLLPVQAGARFFAKKGRKKKETPVDETTEEEHVEETVVEEVVEEPTPVQQEPAVDFSGASAAQPIAEIKADLF